MTELYDGRTAEDWHEELSPQKEWMSRHFFCAMGLLGIPDSILDVGCGFGWMVADARSLGIEAFGVDQLPPEIGSTYIFHQNLVNKFELTKPVSWVWCTEVAEHLDQSAHSTLCDTLVDNLAKDGRLIFSAAHPSQGGSGHLSERPSHYWQDRFSERELGFNHLLSVQLALLWSNIGSPLYWLPANVMVFEK